MFDVIRGLGTPAGIMQYFLPRNSTDYFPQELYDEFYWFSLQENFWTTQFFALQELVNTPHSFNEDDFPRHVPIAILMSHSNVTQRCVDNLYPIDSADCFVLQREAEFYDRSRLEYQNRTDNATVMVCEGCDLGFPVKKPHFVARALLSIFGGEETAMWSTKSHNIRNFKRNSEAFTWHVPLEEEALRDGDPFPTIN